MVNEIFLKILKSALQGKTFDETLNLSATEYKKLLDLADNHRLLPLVYDCVYESCPLHDEVQKRIRSYIKQLVTAQALNSHCFLSLYSKLSSQGIEPVVVKGIICRNLYPKGDLRISSDEDLLVTPEAYEDTLSILSAEGFAPSKNNTDKYQSSYHSPEGLHIELHKSLFDDNHKLFSEYNRLFKNSTNKAVYIKIDSVLVKTLSPTHNLLYLILHALKHFLHSGVGIRQICDIILFAEHYGQHIDWDELLSSLEKVHAYKFALGIFSIGYKHLGFSKVNTFIPHLHTTDTNLLLDDILSAGVYGSSTLGRLHSASITLGAAEGKKEGLFKRAFPPLNALGKKYDYAKKCPLLLPVAWTHRLLRYKKETSQTPHNSPGITMDIGKKRLSLLKLYGLLPDSKKA